MKKGSVIVMPITLEKNKGISLRKNDRSITKLLVGLGWEANSTGKETFDLDASAFLLAANEHVRNEEDLVFYGALDHKSGAVKHMGDDLKGGDGTADAEQINVDLTLVPESIQSIVFTVTIYDYDVKGQNFGQVRNAYIRVIDMSPNQNGVGDELARYDLSEDFSTGNAVIAATIKRNEGDWKFTAVGEELDGGLKALCHKYGVRVQD